MEGICTFPGCQGSIPLAPLEMWLTAWGVRCAGVLADVEHCDTLKVFINQSLIQVLVLLSLFGVCPSFPNSNNLDDDFDSRAGVFGECCQSGD